MKEDRRTENYGNGNINDTKKWSAKVNFELRDSRGSKASIKQSLPLERFGDLDTVKEDLSCIQIFDSVGGF